MFVPSPQERWPGCSNVPPAARRNKRELAPRARADNIILESNQIRRIDFTLEVGAVGTEVTVKSMASLVRR
jgi:hypothetical protein